FADDSRIPVSKAAGSHEPGPIERSVRSGGPVGLGRVRASRTVSPRIPMTHQGRRRQWSGANAQRESLAECRRGDGGPEGHRESETVEILPIHNAQSGLKTLHDGWGYDKWIRRYVLRFELTFDRVNRPNP